MIIVGRQYTETETSKTREDAPSHTSKKESSAAVDAWVVDGNITRVGNRSLSKSDPSWAMIS